MIDPITAISAATVAFSTVKKFVNAGQDFENVAKQLGKWYTASADFRYAQTSQKKPPIFKKILQARSVEEEAFNLLIHEKKLMEQEKELATLLNYRFGWGTMEELKEMRRKIRKQREATVYKQEQQRKAFLDTLAIVVLAVLAATALGAIVFIIGVGTGKW
jgi:hypothetical protein|tara:strand:- start:2378 stop:2860 length:483 start_codon:yes stop_codon:yes gene_type:complete